MRPFFVLFSVCLQVVISQTQQCLAILHYESEHIVKSTSLTKRLKKRGYEQSIGIQVRTIQAISSDYRKNLISFVADKVNFRMIDSGSAHDLAMNQFTFDQLNSDDIDKRQQLETYLIFSLAAFLQALSTNSPKKLQRISIYLIALFYFSMNGVTAQPSTMAPVCSNCPACLVPFPNTCLYCGLDYYYSVICYHYTTMPGCTAANGKNCYSCNPSYFLGASNICISCSSAIANCQSCTSSSACSLCITGYTFNSISLTCDICSLTLPNCTTCSSKILCTACVNQSVILNSSSKCELCQIKKPGCYRCTSLSCIQCKSGYFLMNSTCQFCYSTLNGCGICINSTICTSCLNTAYKLVGNTCIPCGNIFPFCQNCTAAVCTTCQSIFFLNTSSQCQCKIGSLIDNECIDIAGCNAAIKYKNKSYCTECDQNNFKFNTSTLICDCKNGFLLNYRCSFLYGCLTMIIMNNKQTCLMCNKSRHFAVNNGECSCEQGYFLEKGDNACYQTCGDGILLYLQCDDGNLIDGDGCTSKCTIEENFICSGGNQTTPSHCLNKLQSFKLILEEVQNVGQYNIAKFQFRIINFDEFLLTLNQTQLFHLEIDKKHKVNSLSLKNNKVTFIVEYLEDLESFSAIFHLNLDPLHFLYPKKISLPFKMISQTAPLVISDYPNETIQKLLSGILLGLSLLGFIILLVAPCYHKMIALETLTILQLCNMAPFLIKGDSLVTRVFSKLSLSNGFVWPLLSDSTTFQIFGQVFEHMSLPKTFSENMFLNECFLIAIVIAFMIVFFVKDAIDNNDNKNISIKRQIRHYVDVYFCNLIFSTTMSLFLFFFIALNCNNFRVYERTYNGKMYESTKDYIVANTYLNSISIVLVLGFIASVGFINIFTFSTEPIILKLSESKIIQIICRQFKILKVKNKIYVAIFLVNLFVSFGILSCLFFMDSQYKVFAYLLVIIPYTLFVLIYRPYICITDNLSICLGQITSLLFLIGLCIKQYFRIIKKPLTLRYELFFCIGLVSLLIIFVATSIVRLVFEWYNDRYKKKPNVEKKRKKNDPRRPCYQKVGIKFDLQETKSKCLNLLSFQQVIKADNPDLLRLKEKKRNNLQEKRSRMRYNAKNISDAFDPIRDTLFEKKDDLE